LTSWRLPRRLAQLYAGLVLYGVSMALMVRSSLLDAVIGLLALYLRGEKRLAWRDFLAIKKALAT